MKFFSIVIIVILVANASVAQQLEDPDKTNSTTKSKDQKNTFRFKSLMHDASEIAKINKAFELFKRGEEYVAEKIDEPKADEKKEEDINKDKLIKEKSKIYLGSILYFSKYTWTVWINGKTTSSQNNHPSNEIYVSSIDGKRATIIWSLTPSKWQILTGKTLQENDIRVNKNNLISYRFTLANNQSFLLREQKIVEGNPRVEININQNNEVKP
jgi:hypothetical protein